MSKITVEKETLQEWFDTLDNAKDPARAAFSVAESIFDVIRQSEAVLKQTPPPTRKADEGLHFNQVQIGKEYRLRDTPSLKAKFRNAIVKVTEKKRTNVVGELQSPIVGYAKGTKFNVKPNALEEI